MPLGTVQIVDPNNPNDYIVINASDFVVGGAFPDIGVKSMERWNPSKAAVPEPPRDDGEPKKTPDRYGGGK